MHVHDLEYVLDRCYAAAVAGEYSLGAGFEKGEEEEGFGMGGAVRNFSLRRGLWYWKGYDALSRCLFWRCTSAGFFLRQEG